MLDLATAIDIMKKYGYTSTSVHPYIYKSDNNIGICYSFVDDHFGVLERVAIFRTKEEMDDFLKKYQWFKLNGKTNNVTMKLDDYSTPSPNIIYYRNGHIMAFDEMFNLEKYDNIESQRKELNEVDKYILVADNLINYYNSIKDEQVAYTKKVDGKLQEYRQKYFDLQNLIDEYNNVNHEHKLLNVDARDVNVGININMERALKERLSQYKGSLPERNEAIDFINEVWNLCLNLEKNEYYFNNKIEEQNYINDIKKVDIKINYMNELLKNKHGYFNMQKNLIKQFAKIDNENSSDDIILNEEFITNSINSIDIKYSYYNKIDPLNAYDYLMACKDNNEYEKVYSKYTTDSIEVVEQEILLPYEEIIKDLEKQFTKLNVEEQNSLILYFSSFRDLLNLITSVTGFVSMNVDDLIKELENKNNYKELIDKYYISLKVTLDNEINLNFKKSVFAKYDFSTVNTFISSCIETIKILTNIKLLETNSSFDSYFITKYYDNLENDYFIDTINNIATVNGIVKDKDTRSVLVTLSKGVKVLYSNRMIDFGELNSDTKLAVKELKDNTISFCVDNNSINKDEKVIVLAKYSSKAKPESGISIVDKLLLSVKNEFNVVNVIKK